MIEKGYEKAMFPRAWNTIHTFAPLFSAGIPLILPSIFRFSSFQKRQKQSYMMVYPHLRNDFIISEVDSKSKSTKKT